MVLLRGSNTTQIELNAERSFSADKYHRNERQNFKNFTIPEHWPHGALTRLLGDKTVENLLETGKGPRTADHLRRLHGHAVDRDGAKKERGRTSDTNASTLDKALSHGLSVSVLV